MDAIEKNSKKNNYLEMSEGQKDPIDDISDDENTLNDSHEDQKPITTATPSQIFSLLKLEMSKSHLSERDALMGLLFVILF